MLGPAMAMGAGGLMTKKTGKKNKLVKYGLPLAGAGAGAYVLGKGMRKLGGGGSWSGSSSDSD